MKIREFDMHGKTVAEAEGIFFDILNEIRMEKKEEEIHFITGNGPIKERLKVLIEQQELEYHTPMANDGMLVVQFA